MPPPYLRFGQVVTAGDALPSPTPGTLFYLTTGVVGTYVCDRLGNWLLWDNITPEGQSSGEAPVWGAITGTLGDQSDIQSVLNAKEAANANIQSHIAAAHAPTDAQKNSDITKAEIEAKLTGEITSHTHPGGVGGAAWGGITGTLSAQTDLQTALDGKQAAGAYATGTGSASGTNTGDQTSVTGSAGTATALQNARTINGVSFNGTANITIEAFPVGSVFIAVVSTNPGTLLGCGTWTAFAAGRVLVGFDAGQTEFDTVEETGGSKTHTLQVSEIPAHTHIISSQTATTGSATSYEHGTLDASSAEAEVTEVTGSTGGGGAHNNLQPYITVYMHKRVA